MKEDDKKYLLVLADELDKTKRIGIRNDIEGNLYIKISDILAKQISNKLREICK